MSEQIIKEKLLSKKASDRQKAAKNIGTLGFSNLSKDLFDAYLKETKDGRSWETQVEMILALGRIKYYPALVIIEPIVLLNKSHDMITYAAAQTYVRLKRKSIFDAQPILHLLKFGGLSLVDGALNPLSYDKMMPPEKEIIELLQLCWDLNKHKDRLGYERNFSDPRYSLAAACAGWDKELTTAFLNHCIETAENDHTLMNIAKNSLKGIHSTLR